MARTMKVRIIAILGVLALAIGLGAGTGGTAYASTGNQAALAGSAVASAATHSTPPRVHPHAVTDCVNFVKAAEYPITHKVNAGCIAGALPYNKDPQISEGIALAVCGGFLLWAKIDHATTSVACAAANPIAVITSTQWCGPNFGSDCLNAWGGGPYVNVYTGGDENSDTSQHFMVIDENGVQNGTAEIMFTGSGRWGGECIGDASDNSGLADVSLDPCALPGQSAGWGTQMTWGTSGCPSGTAWFKDGHWPGYLGPADNAVNGSPWYLNKPSKVCLAIWTDVAA